MNELTVAICAYNCEKYIEETLCCVINQTYQNFDLLIINDCSTDNSSHLIKSYLEDNIQQYKIVNFEENHGIAYARKYVLENVNSKYIIFVDADDKPYPELVEKLYNIIISDHDLMAVGCYHEYIDKYGKKIGGGLYLGEDIKEKFIKKAAKGKLIFMQPTAILNKDIALKAGGFITEGYFQGKPRYQDYCEDLDLWSRMSDFYKSGKAIIVIPEVLCQYRKMENTASSNSLGMLIKIKYVKMNLKLRRRGLKEMTFIEFYNSLTEKDIDELKKETRASELFREGIFLFRKSFYFQAIKSLMLSFIIKPKHTLQKLKYNLIK